MTSEEFADSVTQLISHARSRVLGIGHHQYSKGDEQQFETMTLEQLLEWAEEEVVDTVNYVAMLHIRLGRIREALGHAGLLSG